MSASLAGKPMVVISQPTGHSDAGDEAVSFGCFQEAVSELFPAETPGQERLESAEKG